MKQYKFYIGTCDKIELVKKLPDREFIQAFDFVFDNYTIERATGRYTMKETGTVVDEETFIVTVFNDFTEQELKNVCNYLKNILNQESILVTITKPEVRFL